jgi:anti-sigma regulatory factor (Ser/Thr protein kinase)
VAGSTVEDVAWLALDSPSSAGAARRAASTLAHDLGLPESRAAEVGLAVTEIAGNAYRHAGGGALLLRAVRASDSAAVEVVAVDTGPGIPDVERARRDGHSTGGTLGIGLGAVERLSDHLQISSGNGGGTVVVARFEGDRRARPTLTEDASVPPAAGITRALLGESACGDAYAVRRDGRRVTLMVADGSGHGPLAAAAAQQAVREFTAGTRPPGPPEAMAAIHHALRGTRGAAVAIAELDVAAGRLRYVGVGNIAGNVIGPDGARGLVSIGGIAGYREPTIKVFEYPLSAGSVVVMHSDGVSQRWGAKSLAELPSPSPLVVGATVLRDAGTRRDDACVLVGRAAG